MDAEMAIRRRKQLPDPSSTLGASINPKSGLPRHPAALYYWRTTGKQWVFQSREPKLTAALKRIKGMRPYLSAIIGGHLYAGTLECTTAKARSIVRGLTRILDDISAHNAPAKIAQEALLLSGREGGENDPNWAKSED